MMNVPVLVQAFPEKVVGLNYKNVAVESQTSILVK